MSKLPPPFTIKLVMRVWNGLHGLADKLIPPENRLMLLGAGMMKGLSIHTAAKLRIADHLADGSKRIDDLAQSTSTDPDSLYRRQNRLEDALGAVETLLAEYTRLEMPGLILMEAETVAPLLELAVRHGVHKSLAERLLERIQALTGPRPVALPSGETLTPREAQVLRLIAQGASNGQIAGQLVITERTVKSHVTSILGKLGVKSRTQAAARARELHIV